MFIPEDAAALEDDLEQVQTLFHADGDGLPRPEIMQLCGPLSALLDVMALDTGILIANYEQVRISDVSSEGGCSAVCQKRQI